MHKAGLNSPFADHANVPLLWTLFREFFKGVVLGWIWDTHRVVIRGQEMQLDDEKESAVYGQSGTVAPDGEQRAGNP